MGQLKIELLLILETPLSVGGAGALGIEADKMVQRDGRDRPIIPASQLKGRLRHACESLAREVGIPLCRSPHPQTTCPHLVTVPKGADGRRLCPVCRLFGSPALASPLRFSDLVYTDPVSDDYDIRPGIGVDRRRGVVQENLLFLTETVLAGARFERQDDNGQPLPAIRGQVERAEALFLLAGLRAIQNWGGAKSRGLGWASVQVKATLDDKVLDLEKEKEVLAEWLRTHRS
jgi:CRISPR/Cas system CSM-associated protein Csm3 (group 7 of RAMP superfamily)